MTRNTWTDWRNYAFDVIEGDFMSETDMLMACLKYMSQQDIQEMLRINGCLDPEVLSEIGQDTEW